MTNADLLDEARKIIKSSLITLVRDVRALRPDSEYLRRYKIRARQWLRNLENADGLYK
jgi:hypothetical protein